MKSRFRLIGVFLVAGVLLCAVSAQGALWLRTTFNDADTVGPGDDYYAMGSQGAGDQGGNDYYWHRESTSGDLEAVAGQGGGLNRAVRFDIAADELETRRYTYGGPGLGVDQLPQPLVEGAATYGYWLKPDISSEGYMDLYSTTATWNGTTFSHGLKHDGTAGPYQNRRLIAEHYANPNAAQTQFAAGEWVHLVITVDGAAQGSKTEKFYINGDLKYTATGRTVQWINVAYRIGGYWTGSIYRDAYFGLMDQIDIWDTELGETEVEAAYQAGPVIPEPVTMVLLCGGALLGLRRRH